ncbi:MAG: agmatine deiminase family protein [Phycisphaeraceae bacterium]
MSHPRINQFERITRPEASAGELGYRMPAEWEPQACVWVARPHNAETWPGCLEQARQQFDDWVEAMHAHVPVSTTDELNVPTNDSWIRDFGPIFVVRDESVPSATDSKGRPLPPLAAHDFIFNGWGGKYEQRELDDKVPQHIARAVGVPLWVHDFVLEGGSVDVNGRGTLLTTEQCLLGPNRNPDFDKAGIEQELRDALGVSNIIWLPGGIEGDDTDGHVDDVARFVSEDTVVAIQAPRDHPDHDVLWANRKALEQARDQDGGRLNVVPLPVPEPLWYDYPADRFGAGGRQIVPASYANFLISNGAVFVPVFGQASDDQALRTLDEVLPGHTVVPVRAEWLVIGLGAVHCLSQQQPAVG